MRFINAFGLTLNVLLFIYYVKANPVGDNNNNEENETSTQNNTESIVESTTSGRRVWVSHYNPILGETIVHNEVTPVSSEATHSPPPDPAKFHDHADCESSDIDLFGDRDLPEGDCEQNYMYGVIVDCGSSGSRANLYRWLVDEQGEARGHVKPMLKDGKPLSLKIQPGLSTVDSTDTEKVLIYIKPLLEFIDKEIPAAKHSQTEIFFLATAGMRLLTNSRVLDTMLTISENGNKQRKFKNVHARILTGREEAVFEWITVKMLTKNYMKSEFGFKQGIDANEVDGIIEMGGASLQVAFSLDDKLDRMIRNRISMNRYKNSWKPLKVPSKKNSQNKLKTLGVSFLGLGSNSVRELAIDMQIHSLIQEHIKLIFGEAADDPNFDEERRARYLEALQMQELKVKDVCMPKGYELKLMRPFSIARKDYFDTHYRSPDGNVQDSSDELVSFSIVGDGSGDKCSILLHDLIDLYRERRLFCSRSDRMCVNDLLRTQFVPFNEIKFVALGDFYYPMELIKATGKLSYNEAYSRAVELCKRTKESLIEEFPNANDFDKNRLQNQCFKSLWGLTFLEYGLRLLPHESSSVSIIKSLNDKSIDWTLGAITYLAALPNAPSDTS